MKNYIYLPISLLVLLIACSPKENQSDIVLETTGFADSTKIYLFNFEKQTSDSGYIVNNRLVFSIDVDEPTQFSIRPVIKSRADIDVKVFWKENKRVTITAEKGKLKYANVEGSELQLQADAVETSKKPLIQANDSLMEVYRSLPREDKEGRMAIRTKAKELTEAMIDVEVRYVKDNPDELFSAITLQQLMTYRIPKEETEALFENLGDEMKASKYGVTIEKYLELSRDFKVGDKAADFQLPDLDGNLVRLSDFEGKYILLDFWASGCGPCRMENPNLLRYYREYKDQGFEILGVSYDKNKDDWANAVKQDTMIWKTVADLQGHTGDVFLTYKVYYFPTYFLIDPKGIIIEKFRGRGQLDKKLKEIFSKL